MTSNSNDDDVIIKETEYSDSQRTWDLNQALILQKVYFKTMLQQISSPTLFKYGYSNPTKK